MRNDLWSGHKNTRWFSKYLPDWLQQKGGRRMVCSLFLACIYWQVSERLGTEQILLTLKYAVAHIALFIGFDPEGTMNIALSGKPYEVSRETVAYMLQLDEEWALFCEGVVNGFGLAILFLFALLTWSFGSTAIEKEHFEKELSQDHSEFETDRTEDHKDVRLEPSKPEPPKPTKATETKSHSDIETPPVESITELIEESENEIPNFNPDPENPPESKPLRLPGRIYRDGS